ncbi:MAG TPA: hypothetical protein VF148_09375 [Acidimicrobiia bacterium]
MLRTRIEDREIEYLLSRQARDDTDGLVSALATLNLERLRISVDDRAADFAVTSSRLVGNTEPTTTTWPVRSRVVPRLATAALAAVVIMGLVGVAEAADAAAPGDTLYGLDRALEQVGIHDGGLEERLGEAQDLAEEGQSTEALAHLADVLDTTSPNAADALEEAAERFGVHDNPSQAVLDDVSAMLDWMAETGLSGQDFGRGVAERAREIGAAHTENSPATKPDTPANDQSNTGNVDRPVDDDGDINANTDDGSSDSSGNGGSGGGSNTGSGGGNGGENGPPGGSPPGQRAP